MSTIDESQQRRVEGEEEMNNGTDYQRDELHTALHERLVQTGEWHRIMASLRASLDESGWSASLREQAQCK
jgi:Transcription factor e(y)2